MASPHAVPTTDLGVYQDLAEAIRRVARLNREVETLQQERDRLTREVEGYREVLHQAVHQLHARSRKDATA